MGCGLKERKWITSCLITIRIWTKITFYKNKCVASVTIITVNLQILGSDELRKCFICISTVQRAFTQTPKLNIFLKAKTRVLAEISYNIQNSTVIQYTSIIYNYNYILYKNKLVNHVWLSTRDKDLKNWSVQMYVF